MKMLMRALAAGMAAVMLVTGMPLTAAAVSTQSEIKMGQDSARHVDAENLIVNDPVLNNWVNSIADNLRRERARPDINYQFKIIDTDDINAFSLPGGFIYVNFGLLNFVNSDDELAGVMGHEMGHVERRHVVTLPAKEEAIQLLVGILSAFSVFAYNFGGMLGSAAVQKISRQDELQADQYGLMLMSRAGYDPNAMVSFMQRLDKEYGGQGNVLEKYFEDHPDPTARIAHLEGYPQLSKTDPTQTLAQAIHDQDEGRFSYSLGKFNDVITAQSTNDLALLHKGEDELALGSFQQSQNAFTQVANAHSSDAGTAEALHELSLLPHDPATTGVNLFAKNLNPLITSVVNAQNTVNQNGVATSDRVRLVRADLQQLNNRINELAAELPDFGYDIRPGSRLEGVMYDLEHIQKDLTLIFDKAEYISVNATDMSKDVASTLDEMHAPLVEAKPTGDELRKLPYYNDLTAQLTNSSNDLLTSVAAARGAVALGWQAMPLLDNYFRKLSKVTPDFGGDLSPNSAAELKPLAAAALAQLDAAADAAEKAHALYFASQSRQIQARLTLLGLNYPEARYNAFAKAVHARLGLDAPTYNQTVQLNMSPGDVAVASWLAAEERVPVTNVINEQRESKKSFIDLALSKPYAPESLEVTLGLWFEGYAEKPSQ